MPNATTHQCRRKCTSVLYTVMHLLCLSCSYLPPNWVGTPHSKEDMPLRKRGDNMGFIDLDQMRNSLPGDPSDSDPGYEVTN